MRHRFILFLSALLTLTLVLSACKSNTSGDAGSAERHQFMGEFMEQRFTRQPLDKYLAAGVEVRPSLSSPMLLQYIFSAGKAQDGATPFEVKSVWTVGYTSSARLIERLWVAQTSAGYRVSKAEIVEEETILIEDNTRLVRKVGDQTTTILDTAVDLPDEVRPYGAPEDLKFGVSRPLTLVSVGLDGRVAFFTGREVHGGLGVVQKGKQDLRMLDVYFEADGRELAWSPDGRYLATIVQTAKPSNLVMVWTTKDWSLRRIEMEWEDATGLRWHDGKLRMFAGGQVRDWDPASGEF